jgi:hypothetical protein
MSGLAARPWMMSVSAAATVTFLAAALLFACDAPAAGADRGGAHALTGRRANGVGATGRRCRVGGFQPLTPWRQPPVELPSPRLLGYQQLTEAGVAQAAHWRHGSWHCEYLGCTHGPHPLLTIWGEVPMLEAVDALETAAPSPKPAAGKWCAHHQEIFDRVKDELHPKIAARKKREADGAEPAAPPTVKAEPRPARVLALQRKILDALAKGPLPSAELAAVCNTSRQDRTLSRARASACRQRERGLGAGRRVRAATSPPMRARQRDTFRRLCRLPSEPLDQGV